MAASIYARTAAALVLLISLRGGVPARAQASAGAAALSSRSIARVEPSDVAAGGGARLTITGVGPRYEEHPTVLVGGAPCNIVESESDRLHGQRAQPAHKTTAPPY